MKKLCMLLALAATAGMVTMCSSSKTAGGEAALPPLPRAAGDHPGIRVQYNVRVPMRDGVKLAADVYTPDGPGPYPVLLTRTPYNKAGFENMGVGMRGAERGFIMVNEDVRGRYASPGDMFYPFKDEIQDGYDSVEWASKLPKSNGKVGMWGGSYDGATQWLAAVADPPNLGGIFPMATPGNYYTDWAYQNGALQQYFAQSWAGELAQNQVSRQIERMTNPMQYASVLPLGNYTALTAPPLGGNAGLNALVPWYLDWIKHPTKDAYWQQWAIDKDYARIHVPVFTMGGWYDLFLHGTIHNYQGVKADGAPAARADDHLLIIPGGHAGWHARVGSVNFGKKADVDYFNVMMDWYDHILRAKPENNDVSAWKSVRYYEMGTGEWKMSDSWPPPEAKVVPYYLHSAGKANSASGNGSLSADQTDANAKGASDRFVYNPADPVPTLGGSMCCDARHLPDGVQDQNKDEARADVLVYSTPVLSQNVNVTGPVSLTLYVSSSAPDTDFTALLADVAPDGTSHNIAEGIVRMRYRDSDTQATFMKPGQIYKVKLDMWATSNVFLKGHRLRVDVSSSNFPRWDRNLNTAESPETGTRFVKATNVIYHDAGHPSSLDLSVMPQ